MSFIQQFFTSRDNNANAETFVGQEGRLWWDPITNQIYSSDGNTPGGIPLAGGGGGNGSPGGANSQVQFNRNGNFGGSGNLTFNVGNGALTAISFVGDGSALSNITAANIAGTVADAAHAVVADSADSVAGANVSGEVANATYATSAGSATTAGTVTTNAQPNITSVGILNSVSATGNITGNYILGNGSQLTGIVTSNYSNANVTAYLPTYTGNLAALTGNVTTTANVSGAYILGNGAFLTGITTSSYSNANVAAYLPTYSGNLAGALLSVSGNVTGSYVFGNGSQLTSITGANVTGTVANATYATSAGSATTAGTVTANAQPNITSVGSLTSITSTGNVTGNYFIGNGSQLTGIVSSYSNTNVAAYLPTYSGNLAGALLSVSGNVTASYFVGNGSQLTGIVSSYGDSNVATLLAGFGSNSISTTGNTTAGYFIGNGSQLTGIVSSYGNSNVAANLAAFGSNPVSTTGNITAGYFVGNGYTLTSVNASNVSGTVANAAYATSAGSATTATTAGTVTTNAQPNITSVGILSSLSVSGNTTGGNLLTGGLISATGNISGNYFIGNGSQLTGIIANVSYGNANVAAYLASGTNSSNIITTANISGSNIIGNLTGATVSMTGNLTSANLIGVNRVFAGSGNATVPSITFSADVGTDSGFYLVSDGVLGITTDAVSRATISAGGFNVVANLNGANLNGTTAVTGGNLRTTGTASATGNITGGNLITGGLVTATGNVNGGNLNTAGQVSATGTITSAGSTNATAFAVGNAAVSNVALGMFPTAGTAGEYAIRDYSTVATTMYFDVGMGTSANSIFNFRTSNSFTSLATINSNGITLTTNRPAFRVFGSGTTNNLTTTQNGTGALTGNNWSSDYTQGSGLNSTTGVFTAPAAGLYQINVVGRNAGISNSISQLAVVKNASGGTGAGGAVQCMIEWAASSSMNHVGSGTVARLAVNDTLALKVLAGQVTFDANDNWSVAYLG